MYINKKTGEVLTFDEANRQFFEEYDGGDPTNPITFDEIYEQYNKWLRDNGFELDIRGTVSIL